MSDKEFLKNGEGSYEELTDNTNKITVTKWIDNKCAALASSFVGATPVGTVKRYSRETKNNVYK